MIHVSVAVICYASHLHVGVIQKTAQFSRVSSDFGIQRSTNRSRTPEPH